MRVLSDPMNKKDFMMQLLYSRPLLAAHVIMATHEEGIRDKDHAQNLKRRRPDEWRELMSTHAKHKIVEGQGKDPLAVDADGVVWPYPNGRTTGRPQ